MTKLTLFLIVTLAGTSSVHAQFFLDRLPEDVLQVTAPSARVNGVPGRMRVGESSCRTLPRADARRRIVDIAVQEWGFFGFKVLDQTNVEETDSRDLRPRRRGPRLSPQESARVAESIAGYWSTTVDGDWILSRQNAIWNGSQGVAARWRDPWSAAFISWVMCEAGFGELNQFRRHIAHYAYIDQAIQARGDGLSGTAYVAYDVGELPIEPGDLVCSARRSAYRSISDRQENIGDGIRSHCDIVIKVDEPQDRVLVIGGNVRGAVRLKLLAATFDRREGSEPSASSVGRGRRIIFAHLKLRADSIDEDALESSPTMRVLAEQGGNLERLRQRLEGQLVTSCCRTDADPTFERRYSVR